MAADRPARAAALVDAVLEATIFLSWMRTGFTLRRRLWSWPPARYDLDGKVALITGGTSGIGRATAAALAEAGASVHVVSRDQARASEAADDLIRSTGNNRVVAHAADLTSLSQVRALARAVHEQCDRLDVLLHNAGLLFRDHGLTDDGIERTVALHVLAPFVLTAELTPRLAAAGRARVVTVSSGGMYAQRLDVERLESGPDGYEGRLAYARAKRAQVALTGEWSRRLAAGIVAHAMHPGWVRTPALQHGLPLFSKVMQPLLREPGQGADTAVWLAASPEAAATSGDFWLDRRRRGVHRVPWTRETPGEAVRLWEWCVERAGCHPGARTAS